MPVIVPFGLLLGFICGVLLNLIADYLPARRHYHLARTDPFASRSIVPAKPTLLPNDTNGRLWPISMWSALIAQLRGKHAYVRPYHQRHILIEVGVAVVFAAITWKYSENSHLGYLLFYAASLILIAVIDIEHRWVFLVTIIVPAVVALVESASNVRVWQQDAIKGGLYGLLIMLVLYVFGLGFGRLLGVLTGRRVHRTVLGFGDVYIGTLGGILVGWSSLGLALLIMVLSGAVAALVLTIVKLRRAGRYQLYNAIPYGPYIVIGIATMLYMPQVVGDTVRWLLGWA